MANFKQALTLLYVNEGRYANDPDDTGGETYMGVARNFWPKWEGWVIIDNYKKNALFPSILDRDQPLQKMVERFYRFNFWDKMVGDDIVNQDVAFSIFDFGVNGGITTSIILAQRVIKVQDDGAMGPKSIQSLNSFNPDLFFPFFKLEKVKYYIDCVKRKPTNEKFLFNWISRTMKQEIFKEKFTLFFLILNKILGYKQ